jgi:glutathione S-transferase
VFLLHVATEADWAEALAGGCYARSTYGRSLAEVGFVHASASHAQLDGVLSSFYADVREPLRLLVIDPRRLTSPWRMDAVPGATEPFPHVYGPVNLDAVVDTAPLGRGGRG